MNPSKWFVPRAAAAWLLVTLSPATAAPPEVKQEIPEPLKPWVGWALWDERDLESPSPYHDPKQALRLWPSRMSLEVNGTGGRFGFEAAVFNETWVPLPGDGEMWPAEVTANGAALPVVEHEGRPAVKLAAGIHQLAGNYRWQGVPQRIAMPPEIGILSLQLDGQPVESPVWDARGFLWLKRDASTEQTDKDFLGIKTHSLLEDGIPLWLHTDVELIVAGKSREETLGTILPAGWKLASVQSPIPVAVDDAGLMKAQVRAGKWTLHLSAFRLDQPAEIAFAKGAKPAVADQLVAFKAQPDFRLVEITGLPAVDVSQTSFPDKWREFPVYRWETGAPFRMEERMRGMGLQKPEGLGIRRELWLDQDGGGLTFRDHITGSMQQIWRLDAVGTQELGSVRADGQGQLITRNPQSGAPGVEIRNREMNLEATGRMKNEGTMHASGWQTDAEKLSVTLNLPPGWRLFALFGADWVHGDWLTAWSLLDLFLLLIFTLAVFRMRGLGAALIAFVGFGLSYHEPGAPRYVWLALLIPLALLKVVPAGWGRRVLVAGKWLTLLALVLVLVPFLGKQIQQAIYPQLEYAPDAYDRPFGTEVMASVASRAPLEREMNYADSFAAPAAGESQKLQSSQASQNLQYDLKARIQTGPGVPEWHWRAANFGWNGPVTAKQTVLPILIPMQLERALSMARVLLLLGLAAVLLEARRFKLAGLRKSGTALALLAALGWLTAPPAQAQFPEKEMLDSLRQRLTETSDAYPTAADIPHVALSLHDRKLVMEAEIHTATRTAVPLPGRLPAWSPVAVSVDGQPEATLRRADGFLWIVLPAGVHRVKVEGLLADLTEWQWTWQLRPRRVTIDAPGWQVGGVKPGGIPEAQVFFTRSRKSTGGGASYDQPNLQSAISVERRIELGLVWQVRGSVSRLTHGGGAVSLRIPLLPGENVITSNAVVKEGFIEVRLGTGQNEYSWQSELPVSSNINLATRKDDAWIERWSVIASPVWNVSISGLPPVFETGSAALVPVWKPWPGETTALEISRPEALAGATVTVGRANHEITLGKRQRTSSLALSLRCSLGEDFLIDLPAGSEATSLTSNGAAIPIRKDGDKVIVPLKPGEQDVVLLWKQDLPLGFETRAGSVRLPVESANIDTSIQVPDDRWVLWAGGPLRGPAVRFWGILLGSLLAAWVLGRMAHSPLKTREWMLLAIGLTQIPLPLALLVVAWLFLLAWRGGASFPKLPDWPHNLLQALLVVVSAIVLGVFIAIVAEGLLGNPEMFISGNNSSRAMLRWFEARSAGELPQPFCFSISIWWYRLSMLLWALWLAAALIRWLSWGWKQFNAGGCFHRKAKVVTPPPLPRA
ncbi:MAG: hypothetical protein EHM17_01430 [Verrucomicrobiaceae bacterium]|nr:MAG: hypothetical protein EHM17_01430 [Verrucomicrobiaceae bacterium]